MGEVYKARDTRLDRIVAVKVSKTEFSERFEREARAISSLNHPYICQLYDVGSNYLVMEYIEGTPVVSKEKPGPLPLDQALKYAAQICDALAAAHKKNITHRDLKPANILVTKQGIKLLDFGLAKQSRDREAAVGEDSSTVTMPLTAAGQLVGTLVYMSPEQLQGKEADARSDIFAFGLVLYELLTGKRAFSGSSQASVIAAILERPAPSVAEIAPAALDRALRKCLAKDPDDRWQSARDLKDELEWIAQAPPAVGQVSGLPAKSASLAWAAAALTTLIALGLAGWMYWTKTQPSTQMSRFEVALPENVSFGTYLSLSPDGRKLVFNATGNQPGLWIRDFSDLEWRLLPGTEGAGSPFWSPDSRFLGFVAINQLKKIDVSGGPAQTLWTVPTGFLGSGVWNRDGIIVFGSRGIGPLRKISESGGVPTELTVVDGSRGELFHGLPTLMPDGKHFLYLRQGPPEVAGMYAGSLDAKPSEQPVQRLLEESFAATYVNGYLLFMRQNTLMAQPFDSDRLQLGGEPVPLAEHVATTGAIGVFSVSSNGALAYRTGTQSGGFQLTWFDRQGKIVNAIGPPGNDQGIAVSPDGTHAVVRDAANDSAGALWTLDLAHGARSRFTFRQTPGSPAIWSPDGSRIAFAGGNLLDTLYEKASSGAGDEKELFKEPGKIHFPNSWSRDGRFLLYFTPNPKTGRDIWVLPLQGDRKPVLLLGTEFSEYNARFSPDMQWIAYTSTESGRPEVYVRPFTASGPSGEPVLGEGKWQVSKDGGDFPKWRADGREILFEAPPNGTRKMAVDVKANGAAFEAGVPRQLFETASGNGWDVTPDGKNFLVAAPQAQQSNQAPITVVLNWPAQLKK
jgi:Tol biopolymer transport system component/tRNA A-37 threonylcarbamoyl transferase component Bud32